MLFRPGEQATAFQLQNKLTKRNGCGQLSLGVWLTL